MKEIVFSSNFLGVTPVSRIFRELSLPQDHYLWLKINCRVLHSLIFQRLVVNLELVEIAIPPAPDAETVGCILSSQEVGWYKRKMNHQSQPVKVCHRTKAFSCLYFSWIWLPGGFCTRGSLSSASYFYWLFHQIVNEREITEQCASCIVTVPPTPFLHWPGA